MVLLDVFCIHVGHITVLWYVGVHRYTSVL